MNRYHSPLLLQLFIVVATILAASGFALGEQAPPVTWRDLHPQGIRVDVLDLPGGAPGYSSPVIAEIDGNTANGKEIAIGGSDGGISVFGSDGVLRWFHLLPSHDCVKTGASNRLFSSPAVGNLYGDGVPYVIVGYGGIGAKTCDGGVAAFRGSDGSEAWNFSTKSFAKKNKFWAPMHGVFSTPALGDVDGNGKLAVGFGSFDRNVYLLNFNGTVRWYYNAADTVWSSAGFANVDKDPRPELIIGTDISQNLRLRPVTKNGGFVYAFKTTPRKNPHISFRQKGSYVWQTYLDQVVYSSPMIADVLPESPGSEVIVGSGCYFPERTNNKGGKWIKILQLSTGKVLQTLKTPGCLSSSVAIGDLDEDGQPEIVASVNGASSIGGDGDGRVMAWNPHNPDPIWSVVPRARGSNDSWAGHFSSPVIADIDGNGSLEVITAAAMGIAIFNGRDGQALTCPQSSCTDLPSLSTPQFLRSTPAIGDLDEDGLPEVFIGGLTGSGGSKLFRWINLASVIESTPGDHSSFSAPWPMFKGNSLRDSHGSAPN